MKWRHTAWQQKAYRAHEHVTHLKLGAIDGLATTPVAAREVTSLCSQPTAFGGAGTMVQESKRAEGACGRLLTTRAGREWGGCMRQRHQPPRGFAIEAGAQHAAPLSSHGSTLPPRRVQAWGTRGACRRAGGIRAPGS